MFKEFEVPLKSKFSPRQTLLRGLRARGKVSENLASPSGCEKRAGRLCDTAPWMGRESRAARQRGLPPAH